MTFRLHKSVIGADSRDLPSARHTRMNPLQALHRCASMSLPGVSLVFVLVLLTSRRQSRPAAAGPLRPALRLAPKGRLELLQDLASGTGGVARNITPLLFPGTPLPYLDAKERLRGQDVEAWSSASAGHVPAAAGEGLIRGAACVNALENHGVVAVADGTQLSMPWMQA